MIIGGCKNQSTEGKSHGNSAAMAIYVMAVIPMMLMLVKVNLQGIFKNFTAAYPDNLATAGPIHQHKKWSDALWIQIQNLVVILKEVNHAEERAKSVFKHTNVKITTERKRQRRAVTRTKNYQQNYIKEKIDQWITELRMLCKIAWYELQPAYSCFITGFKHKPTYLMQTIPNISNQLKQLDGIFRTFIIVYQQY